MHIPMRTFFQSKRMTFWWKRKMTTMIIGMHTVQGMMIVAVHLLPIISTPIQTLRMPIGLNTLLFKVCQPFFVVYLDAQPTILGSGDSTLPSPLPSKKKTLDQAESSRPLPDRIIVPSDDLQTNHVELYNPLEPPAPESLARRLEALSAESPSNSPTLFEFDGRPIDYPTQAEFAPPFNTAPDSPGAVPALSISSSSASPPPLQRSSDEFVVIDPATDPDAVNPSVPAESLILSSDDSHDYDPAQDILRENIKGLYRLWKLGRHDTSTDTPDDKEIFLATVRQALQQLWLFWFHRPTITGFNIFFLQHIPIHQFHSLYYIAYRVWLSHGPDFLTIHIYQHMYSRKTSILHHWILPLYP